jgi:hypothetical protein
MGSARAAQGQQHAVMGSGWSWVVQGENSTSTVQRVSTGLRRVTVLAGRRDAA